MKSLAFYSCFFGSDTNWALVIPKIPSNAHDCYFYTNNSKMVEKLKDTDWKVIYISSIPIHNCNVRDALEAKYFKACPHRLHELQKYDYTCYSDSKINVNGNKVKELIEFIEANNKLCSFPLHPCNFKNIWGEFNLAMKYPKYFSQKNSNLTFINEYLKKGYSEFIENHYYTGFILRKHCETITKMNEEWYDAILKCGIECQISFSFIQQNYKNYIFNLPFKNCFDNV